jgi:hypothetical protein
MACPACQGPGFNLQHYKKRKKKLLQDEKSYQLNRHNIIIEDYAAQLIFLNLGI